MPLRPGIGALGELLAAVITQGIDAEWPERNQCFTEASEFGVTKRMRRQLSGGSGRLSEVVNCHANGIYFVVLVLSDTEQGAGACMFASATYVLTSAGSAHRAFLVIEFASVIFGVIAFTWLLVMYVRWIRRGGANSKWPTAAFIGSLSVGWLMIIAAYILDNWTIAYAGIGLVILSSIVFGISYAAGA